MADILRLCATLRAVLGKQVPFLGLMVGLLVKVEAVVGGIGLDPMTPCV